MLTKLNDTWYFFFFEGKIICVSLKFLKFILSNILNKISPTQNLYELNTLQFIATAFFDILESKEAEGGGGNAPSIDAPATRARMFSPSRLCLYSACEINKDKWIVKSQSNHPLITFVSFKCKSRFNHISISFVV